MKQQSKNLYGERFGRWTVIDDTPDEVSGERKWRCRCDCGNEVDVPYNSLVYCSMKSCGCQKKENDLKLQDNLTHVDGTSIDHIRSQTIPSSNTTGYRGVYLIRGKYVAKIVFQQKQYPLGSYKNIDDAVKARRKAEILVFDETAAYYEKWQMKADANAEWAKENPIKTDVKRVNSELTVSFTPCCDKGDL